MQRARKQLVYSHRKVLRRKCLKAGSEEEQTRAFAKLFQSSTEFRTRVVTGDFLA